MCRPFGQGERPGGYAKENVLEQTLIKRADSTPDMACPQCRVRMLEDPQIQGTVICPNCGRRFPIAETQYPDDGAAAPRMAASGWWLALTVGLFVLVLMVSFGSVMSGNPGLSAFGTALAAVLIIAMAFSTVKLFLGSKGGSAR